LESKVEQCIARLMHNNKELSVNNIQQDLQCSYAQAQSIKEQTDASKAVKNQQPMDTDPFVLKDTKSSPSTLVNKPLPMQAQATIYNMQGTFSDLASKLWTNLAQSAQLEINAIEMTAEKKLLSVNEKLAELDAKLSDKQQQLAEAKISLAEQMQYIEKIETINKELYDELEQLKIDIKDTNQQTQLLKKQLTAKSDDLNESKNSNNSHQQALAKIQKIASRADKEKVFLTNELMQLQKELIQADTIILDLYENRIIDNYTLEKAGYNKHLKAMNSQSLTNKLFKNKN